MLRVVDFLWDVHFSLRCSLPFELLIPSWVVDLSLSCSPVLSCWLSFEFIPSPQQGYCGQLLTFAHSTFYLRLDFTILTLLGFYFAQFFTFGNEIRFVSRCFDCFRGWIFILLKWLNNFFICLFIFDRRWNNLVRA